MNQLAYLKQLRAKLPRLKGDQSVIDPIMVDKAIALGEAALEALDKPNS